MHTQNDYSQKSKRSVVKVPGGHHDLFRDLSSLQVEAQLTFTGLGTLSTKIGHSNMKIKKLKVL